MTCFTHVCGFNLECQMTSIAGFIHAPGQGCWVKNLIVTTQNQTVTSINNQTGNYFHDKNIKFIYIAYQTLNYMPIGIVELFPNITALQIFDSKLKSIKKRDLEPFRSLMEVYFQSNLIESLDNDLLEHNQEIRIAHFTNNRLKFVGENIFNSLKKLERVDLTDNICISRGAVNPSEIEILKAEIKEKCQIGTKNNIKNEKDKMRIKSLESENVELKSKLSSLEAKLKLCEENFEAVTKPL